MTNEEALQTTLKETQKHLNISSGEIARLREEVNNWRSAAEATTAHLKGLQTKFQMQNVMIEKLIFALKAPLESQQMRFRSTDL